MTAYRGTGEGTGGPNLNTWTPAGATGLDLVLVSIELKWAWLGAWLGAGRGAAIFLGFLRPSLALACNMTAVTAVTA